MNSRPTTCSIAWMGGVVLALGLISSSLAQPAQSGVEGLAALKTASEAARLGEAREDPWALALAARLRRTTPTTAVDRRPEGVAERTPTVDPSMAWLTRARSLGRYDRALLAFVDEVQASVFRGRRGGPRISTAELAPAQAHRYVEIFQSGVPAAVYVEGDGDTDLELRVLDATGAAACAEDAPGDIKLCSWTPRAAGRYVIQVTNRGAVRNRYALATN